MQEQTAGSSNSEGVSLGEGEASNHRCGSWSLAGVRTGVASTGQSEMETQCGPRGKRGGCLGPGSVLASEGSFPGARILKGHSLERASARKSGEAPPLPPVL